MTGYTGQPHVTADMARLFNGGMIGIGKSYVMEVGEQLRAEIVNNAEIRILSGVAIHQGCVGVTPINGYDRVTIANGAQGQNRKDLIVLRYKKDSRTQVESMSYEVIKGTPTSGTPSAPQTARGTIASGAMISDMPLYEVNISGISISSVSKIFSTVPTYPEIGDLLTGEYFNGKPKAWPSRDWLAAGQNGVYYMNPTNNPTNHPEPGKYGWMMAMDTLRVAFIYASGNMYIRMKSGSSWTGWINQMSAINSALSQMTAKLYGIGQAAEAGSWGSTWNLDGTWRTLGNKRSVDNDFYSVSGYDCAITVKKAGTYIATVQSTFFPTGDAQADHLVKKNGTPTWYTSHALHGHDYFSRVSFTADLNAGDTLSVFTRCYGSVQCNGWDIFRLVKII